MFCIHERGDIVNRSKAGMKRPWSPGQLENALPPKAQEEEEEAEEAEEDKERVVPGQRPKRERRQSSVTQCEVCNIQLNSSAQAQIHYNGKTHQRKLRQFRLTKASSATHNGSLSQANPLLASLSLPGRPLQTQLDLKHFLPLRVNSSSPLSLFPNFNTSGLFCAQRMDPVQKAVINHTFGVAPPKKKQIISCNICHLRFNSTNQAEAHYKGHKHARKLKAMDSQRNRQRGHSSPAGRERDSRKTVSEALPAMMDPSLTEKTCETPGLLLAPQPPAGLTPDDSLLRVPLIPMPVSKASPLDASVLLSPQVSPAVPQLTELTTDHRTLDGPILTAECDQALEPVQGQGETLGATRREGETEAVKKSPPAKQNLHCPVCKVTVNSSSQLEAHYRGSKHKQMLEGQACAQVRRRGKLMSSPRSTCRTKQPPGSGVGVTSQPFHCKMCEVSVNSEMQLKQHMNSRRHKDRLAGKPHKPKFSPYTKGQLNPALANVRWTGFPFGGVTSAMGKLASHCQPSAYSPQTKLALQKQLSKALSAGFLASHLNPATLCAMTSNPLALRGPPGPSHTAMLQNPLLSPTLFRPAPGPLRATHAPIIFSPY
ncbi:zinc finger protein 385B isoform X1 [Esox lucius]|nr:zinc finger protein 385B isoform X1 [Esox lucius]